MSSVFAIILLIVFGILLILLEFLVVPGITIAGLGGLAMLIGGVYLAYDAYGAMIGTYTLVGTLIASSVALVLALRSNTWKRFMLNSEIKSHAFDKEDESLPDLKPGDTGITVSRVAPVGKVRVGDIYIEAKAQNAYLDPNTEVVVVKVFPNQIIVKPKN